MSLTLKQLPTAARPREKLLARGVDALCDAELLAVLLRTGTRGRNVLQLAEDLLRPRPSGFGGISGLLHAGGVELQRIKGLGPAKRCALAAALELVRRALAQQLQERRVFEAPDAVRSYLQLVLSDRRYEVFAVLFLDHGMRMLALEELSRGTVSESAVDPREVLVRALHHGASGVVLAHNHPSGSIEPSRADRDLTQRLSAALRLIDVRVLDHVIVAPGTTFSFAERGML